MRKIRLPPLPFLVLLVSGVVVPIAILAGRLSPAPMNKEDSLRVQMVEQERLASIYFRILSWLAHLTPATHPASETAPQRSPAPQVGKTSPGSRLHSKIELCTPSGEHKSAGGERDSKGGIPLLPILF